MRSEHEQRIAAAIRREAVAVRRLERTSMQAHGLRDGRWVAADHALMVARRRLVMLRACLAERRPA